MIKYPNLKKVDKDKQKYKSYTSNLGMTLESDLDSTNQYYLVNNIAVIHKKPTPVQIVDVSYPSRNKAKIVEAYYKTPSTTDYNGIFQGRYIDFDAKETKSKTSLPLSNIHPHQVEHLRQVNEHGGIAFLIVHWKHYDEYYYLPCKVLFEFWDNQEKGRKSIPYEAFQKQAHLIKFKYNPRIDYLEIIRLYYLK
ncbi:MAG: Holliday junction resolvase RecU [Acholeplasmataceae bacterium]